MHGFPLSTAAQMVLSPVVVQVMSTPRHLCSTQLKPTEQLLQPTSVPHSYEVIEWFCITPQPVIATHLPAVHCSVEEQLLFVVQATFEGAATQTLDWQTLPLLQSLSTEHSTLTHAWLMTLLFAGHCSATHLPVTHV